MWIMFDNKIKDMEGNEKISSLVIGLFMIGRKLNISVVFILQSYLKMFKDKKLNGTYYRDKYLTKENSRK